MGTVRKEEQVPPELPPPPRAVQRRDGPPVAGVGLSTVIAELVVGSHFPRVPSDEHWRRA